MNSSNGVFQGVFTGRAAFWVYPLSAKSSPYYFRRHIDLNYLFQPYFNIFRKAWSIIANANLAR